MDPDNVTPHDTYELKKEKKPCDSEEGSVGHEK